MGGTDHHKPNRGGVAAVANVGIDAGKPHTAPYRGEPPVLLTDVFASSHEISPTEPPLPFDGARGRVLSPPKLDARLRAVADWVQGVETVADIGCDHGRFGAVLLSENRCKRLLAADVSAKALAKAQTLLLRMELADRTVFAVADGLDALDALPGATVGAVCILGMGGDTLAGILERGQGGLHGATLLLGAQTELPVARAAVQAIGYRLTDERVVQAEGRLYLLMRATPNPGDCPAYTERELMLGPCLLSALPPEWQPWLLRRQRLLTAAIAAMRNARTQRDALRMAAAQRELSYTREALEALEHRLAPRQTGEDPVT
ncbi:MAG TPA: class I SAM-dependent methyltransferase [Candidatus Limiplasma sp.]|nr:class I SAM-dependent methyltransferase [Candidatus Limiplasma sp.]HPS81307.1 class I SAM-dependent methyltransferase [Candidatus Limiplasma sp.]